MINDPDEAQDVLQNSFIDVFTKLQMFRYESTIGAWIKRIVINNCINHIRKNKNEFVSLDAIKIPDTYEEPNDVELNISEINNAILDLPEGYKVIFSLYAVEGYDHGEIAEILGISESTSKSQYHRAKTKLYDILKSNGGINRIYQ